MARSSDEDPYSSRGDSPAAGRSPSADPARSAVADLRRARRRRRLGGHHWGELAYRAYTTALAALVAVVFLSGLVGDEPLGPAGVTDFAARAPAVFGLLAAVAVLVGLRSGTRGGPLALEAADVQHLLLGPADRTWVLRRPAVGVLAYGCLGGAVAGGVTGGLVDQRIGQPVLPWIAAGAVFGVTTVALSLGAAMLACSRRFPRAALLGLGWLLLAWSALDTWSATIGSGSGEALWFADLDPVTAPLSWLGHVAVWPLRFRPGSLAPPAVAVLAALVGLAVVGGVSVELAQRRTALVGQLRFAATQRDLRTVVLLRRQLAAERPRRRRWLPALPDLLARRWPVLARDLHSVARWPLVRIVRVTVLAAAAGAAAWGVFEGTTPLVVAAGVAAYVAALDAIEPLAQEIDHPTLLASYPVPEGVVMFRHLAGSLVVLLAAAAVLTAAGAALGRDPESALLVGVLSLPAAFAAVAGAAITVVSEVDVGVPENPMAMASPEVAGPRLLFRTAWPPLVATLGFVPVLLARSRADGGADAVAGALTGAVPVLALCAVVFGWVRFRADIHRAMAQAGGASR